MKKPSSRLPKLKPEEAPPTKLPEGRYARVWLSPEFLAYAKRQRIKKPARLAAASAHTLGLKAPARLILISTTPGDL